jgi:hypothetical protein
MSDPLTFSSAPPRSNVLLQQRINDSALSTNFTCIYVHLRASTCMFFFQPPNHDQLTRLFPRPDPYSQPSAGLPPRTRSPAIARQRDGGWLTHPSPFMNPPSEAASADGARDLSRRDRFFGQSCGINPALRWRCQDAPTHMRCDCRLSLRRPSCHSGGESPTL